MKFILLVLCIFWGCSCTQRTKNYPLFMQEAVKCMDARPDRALELLKYLEDSLPYFPEETQMYYHLLCIQAKDKQYITHTSDSLINRIVEFYERRDDADKKMMAYYYQGSVYRDMNDAPRALKAYQQAVDISTPENELLPKVYNQMGKLFTYQGLYDEVIKVNKKSIGLYINRGMPNKISYQLRDIARMYDIKEKPDSALLYYKKACDNALAGKDSIKYYRILSEKAGFYFQIGIIDSAKHLLLFTKNSPFIQNKNHIYSMLGHIYKNELQIDSANYYYQKAALNGDIRQSYNNYRHLFVIESQRKNYNEAIININKALVLKDSIDKITKTEAIAQINSLYNYQHTETENSQLKINKEKQKNWILTLSLILLITISLCIYQILYLRQKKTQAFFEQKEKERQEAQKYAKSEAAIRDNEIKIAELDTLLEESLKENDFLKQELLHVQQKRLKAQNEEIIQLHKEQELLLADFKRSNLYKEIWLASNNENLNLSFTNFPEKWISIQENIDLIYPNFTERLKVIYPKLSYTELQVCWLTKVGLSPSGIARVLNVTKQAITNARSRLTKKLNIKEGNWENFNHFIDNM